MEKWVSISNTNWLVGHKGSFKL